MTYKPRAIVWGRDEKDLLEDGCEVLHLSIKRPVVHANHKNALSRLQHDVSKGDTSAHVEEQGAPTFMLLIALGSSFFMRVHSKVSVFGFFFKNTLAACPIKIMDGWKCLATLKTFKNES